jgi:hypothetical protein
VVAALSAQAVRRLPFGGHGKSGMKEAKSKYRYFVVDV